MLTLLLYALLLSCIVMTLVWWRQYHTRNAGIVDGWWSYIFAFIVILYALAGLGDPTRKNLIAAMVVIWSARLGTHLLIRNTHHTGEDSRYRKLREEYGKYEHIYMWRFFIYQALSNVLLSVPFLLVCQDPSPQLSPIVTAGVTLWGIAIVGEAIADRQLKAFKQDPANHGKVCNRGLWRYSRHPNYFFEWLVWVAFGLVALDSPHGAWGLGSAVIMFVLLNYVTGIPMLETLAVESKSIAYTQYQKTTSPFFPWFKRKTDETENANRLKNIDA